jgi:hypothetical protein
VLRGRIELPTSSLPMMCSTTELPQQAGASAGLCHTGRKCASWRFGIEFPAAACKIRAWRQQKNGRKNARRIAPSVSARRSGQICKSAGNRSAPAALAMKTSEPACLPQNRPLPHRNNAKKLWLSGLLTIFCRINSPVTVSLNLGPLWSKGPHQISRRRDFPEARS